MWVLGVRGMGIVLETIMGRNGEGEGDGDGRGATPGATHGFLLSFRQIFL